MENERGASEIERRRELKKIEQKIYGLYDAIADGLKARLLAMR